MPTYLSSAEAAATLGVSRQTLYAYVSRGLLTAQPAAEGQPGGSRNSRYLAAEVQRLVKQRSRGRKPQEVAKATLSWGLPVLESGLTLIEDGRLYYRGRDAVELAQQHSVEQAAAWIWNCPAEAAFGTHEVPVHPAFAAVLPHYADSRIEVAMLPLFTVASEDAATALWQSAPERLAAGCGNLMRLLAASLLGQAPSSAPIHQQCAAAWQLNAAGADLVRQALILCADHELNASSFTARCIASTGTSLRAAVVGGLAALTGGKHGGTTARVEALFDETGIMPAGRKPAASRAPATQAQIREKMQQRLERGDFLPGFGHHLYPDGDVRAKVLLQTLLPQHADLRTAIAAGTELTGQHASLDLALAAIRRHLQLPPGAAYGIFALGRGMGWIAQALEQRANDQLIRPRAAYTGPRPGQTMP